MPKKPPSEERRLVLARDQRRKYGARITFQVQRPEYIGELENVTLFIDDGTLATVAPGRVLSWEGGHRYTIEVVGYPTARDAEEAGMRLAQSLLLTAVSLNFGLRLNYSSHEPPTVFDRTVSKGMSGWAEGFGAWSQEAVLYELSQTLSLPLKDRRLLLSMELYVASALESNERAKFVMAVSALEPLAAQLNLGPEVAKTVDSMVEHLATAPGVPRDLKTSLRGRLIQLKHESIRQALKRLSATWFPDDKDAWQGLDRAYALRSELLHEGRPNDLDVLLSEETQAISRLLRRIYQQAFAYTLRSPISA